MAKKAVEKEALDDETAQARQPASLSHVRSLRPPPPRPIVLWLAAAAVVLALGGEWLIPALSPPKVAHSPPATAPELRQQAVEACHAGRYRECLARIDEAARLDPAGDADRDVQAQRANALEAIGVGPK
jgi:hypothetical protein